ncbi:MAG: putative NOP5 family protein [Candidatus Methanofastidiosum methylothiophilum]|uniref:Putative NOP5 family protein n=1 Tax=Candidatus Methanofastidiosum methylothiophilum TaxID=1705564 RepID=A0A150ISR6_9EURY|nr:MAG: putative NOP5 family protein [Candidatus Methanofastidiosum methylthiophilus]KYC48027.1 MAG: putative NOP5 family protein [Candidatus Methanofastidiosum methylthiophilus]KYC50717.1 MAG: putative NOP5 family protein [Candidatus Methanofastidiosum methylthiophilus]
MFICVNVNGIYLIDKKGNISDFEPFSKGIKPSVKSILKLEKGKIPFELKKIIERNPDLSFSSEYELKEKTKFQFDFPSDGGLLFRENYLASLKKASINEEEYRKKHKSILQELARIKVASLLGEKDKLIIHAVYSLNEFDETINLFLERLREWYSIHFPESVAAIPDNKNFVEFIIKIGNKASYQEKRNLLSYESNLNNEIIDRSLGAELSNEDISQIKEIADLIEVLYTKKESLENYITNLANEVAPNTSMVATPILAAKLISHVGGLKNLSVKPSSTIQLLGAEKALFRHIKTGADPPKYGIILQYPEIGKAPWWQKGKIARTLAAKIAIAARVDNEGGEFVGDALKNDLVKRIAEIERKYPNAPPKKEKQPKKKFEDRPKRKFEKSKFNKGKF